MSDLVEYIRGSIDVKRYYQDQFKELQWPASSSEGRVSCIFHNDGKTPSLSLNPENGKWYCHGCAAGGESVVSFHAKRYECSTAEAARSLFHHYVHPTIPEKKIRRWKRKFWETPSIVRYMTKERFIGRRVLKKRDIGWDGTRVVIPIRNEFGICVNCKLFDPLVSKGVRRGKYAVKMLNYQVEGEERSHGSPPMLYPIDNISDDGSGDWIFVCSGELDALVLEGLGLRSVTSTAGEKSWPEQYNHLFHGRKVAVPYDNDEAGNLGVVKRVVPNLSKYARKIKRIEIPKVVGKDVTDYYREDEQMREAESWLWLAKKSKTLIDNPLEALKSVKATRVPLDQASRSEFFNKRISVDALVAGKDTAPYILPKKARVSCSKQCETCPMADDDKGFREVTIDPTDPRVLRLVDASTSTVDRHVGKMAGLNCKPECEVKVERLESFNVERLLLIPTLDSRGQQYVTRAAYHVGHGLHSNRAYSFQGVTTVHPEDQHATHLFDQAKPAQDEIETFQLKPELRKTLEVFRPRKLKLLAHLMGIAEWQSRHITKIKDRPDLHVAVDLVFHSVTGFQFNGEAVRRGMLDVLIIGDTRCGKGYVAEGISRYLGLGQVVSADNCSFAGLVGGIDQVAKRNMVKWGAIPLNNDRLVVIDEASSLSHEEISNMTRIRSEGVAEIHKIASEVTRANTRLLWLSNTRDGQPIMEQGTGVKAIKQLMGANEDISRFDFAMTVATNEVPSEVINDQDQDDVADVSKYPPEACRALVLWAWSRKPEQVYFTRKATTAIIQQAIRFGKRYSPKVPLVQAENIRIKLAKISAAIAARVFSSDDAGERLIIKQSHVECACHFLHLLYSKPSMSYDIFSATALASAEIEDPTEVFKRLGADRKHVVNGLLEIHKITVENLSDYLGDLTSTRFFVGDLVKARCLSRIEGAQWYIKNPTFTAWLRKQKGAKRVQSNGQADSGKAG